MNLKIFNKNNKVLADTSEPRTGEALKAPVIDTSSVGESTVSFGGPPPGLPHSSSQISPSKRERIKTLGYEDAHESPASRERMKRNTDSMLEDAVISSYLRKRLDIRRQQASKRTLKVNDKLSQFILNEIASGKELEAESAVTVTDEKKSKACDQAIRAAMEGYFSNLDSKSLQVSCSS